jgi:hypothetical protein
MKAAIMLERYKLGTFERHLRTAGFDFEVDQPAGADRMAACFIKVHYANENEKMAIAKLCRAALEELALPGSDTVH